MATRRELLGYADRLSVAPGQTIRFMVSSELPSYEATITRLIHGDQNPAGPGFKEAVVPTAVDGAYTGRRQAIHPGSYVRVAGRGALDGLSSLTLQAWIFPTTPTAGRVQGLLTRWSADGRGYGLFVEADGTLAFRLGDGGTSGELRTPTPLLAGVWYFVAASFDAASGAARLFRHAVPRWPLGDADDAVEGALGPLRPSTAGGPFLIGAGSLDRVANGHYNGKIERPRLFRRALEPEAVQALRRGAAPDRVDGDALVADWDFAADPASAHVRDRSPNGLHGTAVNAPTRAVTGHGWDGRQGSHVLAPEQYGAIHFHDDDLEDCGWEADFELTVPEGLPSGVYAARLRAEDQEEHVPFWVRPRPGTRSADVLFLAPTLTYLAYGNERLIGREDFDFSALTNIAIRPDPNDLYLQQHPELGGSTYDQHSDGSGIGYSSYLRPILTMRPKLRYWILDASRHFGADLYLIDWLEAKGFAYDVATDHDLHAEGRELLSRYRIVLTGSHPEYWTAPMLDALEGYLDGGGRLMYLGGNGFYWVSGIDPERPHLFEVRRGHAGIRAWESRPGEAHLASTGEPGGLWRYRGRAPNRLSGVGFTAQGWDLKTPGYVRLPDSFAERARFIFEGVGADEVVGDFGLVMNGAAGDEIDRVDRDLGTPPHALRLATTQGRHSDYYMLAVEEMLLPTNRVHGSDNPLVRADMVYFETPGGGAVFSVGSMTWSGSLSHNGYDNNVSRVTENVLRRFLEPRSAPPGRDSG